MAADSIVRSRIDTETKERAAAALEAMGLTISDAIRLLLLRVADEKRLPFEVRDTERDEPPCDAGVGSGQGRTFRFGRGPFQGSRNLTC